MAKIKITNQQLIHMMQEYNELNKGLLGILLASKLREFINNNGVRFNAVRDKQDVIFTKYILFDNGNAVMTEAEEGKVSEPVFKEGFFKEDFQKEMNEFLQSENTMDV